MSAITWKNVNAVSSDTANDLLVSSNAQTALGLQSLTDLASSKDTEQQQENTDQLKNFIANQTLDTVGTDATRAGLEQLTQGKNNNFDQSVYRDGLDKHETALQSAFTADNAFNETQQGILRKPYEEQFKSIVASEGLDKGLNYLNGNKEHFGGKVADMQKWGNDHQASTHAAEVAGLSRDYGTYAEEAKALYQKGDYPGGDALVEKYGDEFSKMGQTSILAAHREAQQDKDQTDKKNAAETNNTLRREAQTLVDSQTKHLGNAAINHASGEKAAHNQRSNATLSTVISGSKILSNKGISFNNGSWTGLDELLTDKTPVGMLKAQQVVKELNTIMSETEFSSLSEVEKTLMSPVLSTIGPEGHEDIRPNSTEVSEIKNAVRGTLIQDGNVYATREYNRNLTQLDRDYVSYKNNTYFTPRNSNESNQAVINRTYTELMEKGAKRNDSNDLWEATGNDAMFYREMGSPKARKEYDTLSAQALGQGIPITFKNTNGDTVTEHIAFREEHLDRAMNLVHSDYFNKNISITDAFEKVAEDIAPSYRKYLEYQTDLRAIEDHAMLNQSAGRGQLGMAITSLNTHIAAGKMKPVVTTGEPQPDASPGKQHWGNHYWGRNPPRP